MAATAVASNKGAPETSSAGIDREPWYSEWGRCGGCVVLDADFSPWSPPSRWRSLWCQSGDCEVIQERIPVAVSHGGSVGGCWSSIGSTLGMWLLAGGSVFLPRWRRAEPVDLHPGDGFRVWPWPMRHKDAGSAAGEPFLRSTKLQDSEGAAPGDWD
jgi:hypothetical protein